MPAGMRRLLLPLIDNEVGLRERLLLADRLVGNPISISEPDSAARTASDALLRDAAQQAKQQLEARQLSCNSGADAVAAGTQITLVHTDAL